MITKEMFQKVMFFATSLFTTLLGAGFKRLLHIEVVLSSTLRCKCLQIKTIKTTVWSYYVHRGGLNSRISELQLMWQLGRQNTLF